MIIFVARDLKQTTDRQQEEEGIIETKKVSFEEALTMIRSGEINDSQCIAAITKAALYLGKMNLSSTK